MKKVFLIGFFCSVFLLSLHASATNKPLVSVSIAPQAFFVEKIAKDSVDVNVILPQNTDEHNFEFKADTMKKLEKSDIYFTIGLEFEEVFKDKFQKNFPKLALADMQEGIDLMHTHHHHDHDEDFSDDAIQDRSITDWEGEFNSVYPLLQKGVLQDFFELKARVEDRDLKELINYYDTGYKSSVDKIKIAKDGTFTFYEKDKKYSAKYSYSGFKILQYKSGKRGVRYQFKAISGDDLAPKFIQFSDHNIKPHKVNHFHIYMGDEGFEKLSEELKNWPTFYLAQMGEEEIVEDMRAHLDEGNDPHTWLDPILVKNMAKNIATILSQKYPQNAELYAQNLKEFDQELDRLNEQIIAQLRDIKNRKFIVYHPSWGYFAARYGLEQIPVEIDGKEPKAKDLQQLIALAKKEKIKAIFVQPGFPENAAKTLAKECGAKVISINHLSRNWHDELLKSVTVLAQNLE